MSLTQRLLTYLHRVFSRDPQRFLALRLGFDGVMTWKIEDGVLTTQATLASAPPTYDGTYRYDGAIRYNSRTQHGLTVDLSQHTLASLADHVSVQFGYSVPYLTDTDSALSALILLDGEGDQAQSNGDHLYAYASLLWAYLDAVARELRAARNAIAAMLAQMYVTSAEHEWIDEWGSYLAVERLAGESDASYRARVIAEPLQMRSTNRALEDLIAKATGIAVEVVDIDWRPDSSNLQQLGLITTAPGQWPTGGYPYWGEPANDNPLVCAFGIILHVPSANDIDALTLAKIAHVVEQHRAAGTHYLYFGPQKLLRTNTAGETANSLGHICGPRTGTYVPIMI